MSGPKTQKTTERGMLPYRTSAPQGKNIKIIPNFGTKQCTKGGLIIETFYGHNIWEPPEVIDHFGLNAY